MKAKAGCAREKREMGGEGRRGREELGQQTCRCVLGRPDRSCVVTSKSWLPTAGVCLRVMATHRLSPLAVAGKGLVASWSGNQSGGDPWVAWLAFGWTTSSCRCSVQVHGDLHKQEEKGWGRANTPFWR